MLMGILNSSVLVHRNKSMRWR